MATSEQIKLNFETNKREKKLVEINIYIKTRTFTSDTAQKEDIKNMDYQYLTRIMAAVVVVLCQCASSVPVQKQSKSSLSESAPIHKRSAATVEFFMNSDSHNTLTHRDDPLEDVASKSEQDFNNMLVCPETVSTELNDPVHKRSICPWYYRVSRDARRFPAVVLVAEPLCDYAIGSQYSVECVPITKSVPVLRQQNYLENGNYKWVEETMTTIIGFTAAGRRLAEATTAAPNNQPGPEWAKR